MRLEVGRYDTAAKIGLCGAGRVRFADRVGRGRRRAAQGPAAALVRPGAAAVGFGAHGARCSAGGCLPHTGGSSSAQRRLTRTGGDPRPHCGRRRGNRPDRDSRRAAHRGDEHRRRADGQERDGHPRKRRRPAAAGAGHRAAGGRAADPHHAHARERGLHPGGTRSLRRERHLPHRGHQL